MGRPKTAKGSVRAVALARFTAQFSPPATKQEKEEDAWKAGDRSSDCAHEQLAR